MRAYVQEHGFGADGSSVKPFCSSEPNSTEPREYKVSVDAESQHPFIAVNRYSGEADDLAVRNTGAEEIVRYLPLLEQRRLIQHGLEQRIVDD